MLHQKMRGADFAVEILGIGHTVLLQIRGMVLTHVMFQRFAVGVCWWLPFGLLCAGVEVVWEVFAVGVTDLLRID